MGELKAVVNLYPLQSATLSSELQQVLREELTRFVKPETQRVVMLNPVVLGDLRAQGAQRTLTFLDALMSLHGNGQDIVWLCFSKGEAQKADAAGIYLLQSSGFQVTSVEIGIPSLSREELRAQIAILESGGTDRKIVDALKAQERQILAQPGASKSQSSPAFVMADLELDKPLPTHLSQSDGPELYQFEGEFAGIPVVFQVNTKSGKAHSLHATATFSPVQMAGARQAEDPKAAAEVATRAFRQQLQAQGFALKAPSQQGNNLCWFCMDHRPIEISVRLSWMPPSPPHVPFWIWQAGATMLRSDG